MTKEPATPPSLSLDPGGPPGSRPITTSIHQRQRRPWQIGLGVAFVVVCGAVAASLFQSTAHRTPVLIATQNLQAGTVLTAADLGVGSLPTNDNISALGTGAEHSLVGQPLAVSVGKGELMVGSMISTTPPLKPGYQLAGVQLKGNQLPTVPIVAGDLVQVIAVPPPASTTGGVGVQASTGIRLVTQAIVIASGPPPANQNQYAASISLEIPASDTTAVAEYSAASEIALTLVGSGGNK
jgi:hypothetical protein